MIFRSTYSKPVLIAGSGVRSAGAQGLLVEFAEKTGVPVLTSMNAVDLVQGDLHIGFIGTHGNRAANMIVAESDLVVGVGVRLGLRQVGRVSERFAPDAHIVRADIDENELARSVHGDEEKILADAKAFLGRLLSEDVSDYSDWRRRCLALRDYLAGFDNEVGNLAVSRLSSLLPENPVVSVDVGQHQCWCAQSLRLRGQEGRIFVGGGYGSMGCGLPYAIGASIAQGRGTVFCVAGDGGIQMNIQELETVRREGLPIKIVVLNNRVLGKISETQRKSHGGRYAQTAASGGYTVPDFRRIAEAYGIKAASLASYEELDAYVDWFSDGEPCLLDVALPSDTALVPKMDWSSGIMKPELPPEAETEALEILRGTSEEKSDEDASDVQESRK